MICTHEHAIAKGCRIKPVRMLRIGNELPNKAVRHASAGALPAIPIVAIDTCCGSRIKDIRMRAVREQSRHDGAGQSAIHIKPTAAAITAFEHATAPCPGVQLISVAWINCEGLDEVVSKPEICFRPRIAAAAADKNAVQMRSGIDDTRIFGVQASVRTIRLFRPLLTLSQCAHHLYCDRRHPLPLDRHHLQRQRSFLGSCRLSPVRRPAA